jgi:hypothetical protein
MTRALRADMSRSTGIAGRSMRRHPLRFSLIDSRFRRDAKDPSLERHAPS